MKKLFLFISMICILMILFTINVLAADVEIGKCDTSDALCMALQDKYGADSTVMYSQTATAVCGTQIEVEVNGTTQVVYISNVEEVAPPPPSTDTNNGQIPDDGIVIKPGDTDFNEIELPKTSFSIDVYIHSVSNSKAVYPYNELNKKLIYIFGTSLYYFPENEYDRVKMVLLDAPEWWKDDYMQDGVDAWIDNNFYKTTVETVDEYGNSISKVLYLSIKPTDDQLSILKMDYINDQSPENALTTQRVVLIVIVVVIVCCLVMVGGYFLIKRLKR